MRYMIGSVITALLVAGCATGSATRSVPEPMYVKLSWQNAEDVCSHYGVGSRVAMAHEAAATISGLEASPGSKRTFWVVQYNVVAFMEAGSASMKLASDVAGAYREVVCATPNPSGEGMSVFIHGQW